MGKYSVLCGALCVWGCGGAPAAANPSSAAGEAPSAAGEPAAASEAGPSGTAEQPKAGGTTGASAPAAAPAEPPKRERIRLHSSCSKPVPLRIERERDSDTDTTLNSNTSTEERATDGDEIRLLDEKRNVLSALKIQPVTQEINVTSDCKRLEAK
jgi:hypothetical protein